MRLWNVTPRTVKGWKSLGGCDPSDCGLAADPAGRLLRRSIVGDTLSGFVHDVRRGHDCGSKSIENRESLDCKKEKV